MTPAEPPIDASERALSRSFGGLYDQWAVGRVPQAVLDRMSARADPRTGLLWWQQVERERGIEAHDPPMPRPRFFDSEEEEEPLASIEEEADDDPAPRLNREGMKQRRESFSNDEFFLGQSTTTGVLVDFCCGGELDDDDEEDDSDSDTESEGGTRRESSKRLVSVREADSFISAGVQSRRNCVLVVFMIALMLIWGTISMHWPPLTSLYFLGRCRARTLSSRAAAGDTRRRAYS